MSINECRYYSDYINNGYILPKKKKYNINDFKKLIRDYGITPIKARFIIICSSLHYYGIGNKATPQYMYTSNFINKCYWYYSQKENIL